MLVYYEMVKLVFFILTFIISLYQLRIKWILPPSVVDVIWPFVMPFYLILIWLIIWYIIWYILTQKRWVMHEEESYISWFIAWWIIWVIISAVYYFMIA